MNHKNIILLIVLFIGSYGIGLAQNLIPDPSFENYSKKERFLIEIKHFKYWTIPNDGSPDVYCAYNKNDWYHHINKLTGTQFPKSGETYIGLDLYDEFLKNDFREYVKTQLLKPLLNGHKYCFSMYVCLGKVCRYACNGLDIIITSENIKINKNQIFNNGISPTISSLGGIITEKNKWVLICGSFIAKGNEKYLIIGNLKDNKNTKIIEVEKKKKKNDRNDIFQSSYYLIDDVSLVEISDEDDCNCNNNKDLLSFADTTKSIDNNKIPFIPAGVSFAIPNLYFAINEWEILPESFSNLDSLFNVLSENSKISILITGHTDDAGKDDWNLKLSENRAKAVGDYFVKKGISAERINCEGKGSTYPIASNETEKGREMNRRVEIMIIKK